MASSGKGGWARLALRVGLFSLRHRIWRRKLMFYLSLAAVVQLAVGAVVMDAPGSSPLLFFVYWTSCGFLVCLMVLLALYDMLAVRQEQRYELKRLREAMLARQREDLSDADDSGDTGET